jgi:hypothetical protein
MSKSIKNQIMYRPLSELHELKNNPRIIKKDAFEKLKKSIADNPEYFEARPLILTENEDGGDGFTILAGNQRYKAALALSLDEAPTVYLKNLSEDKKREIVIRDNVENGEWDFEELANNWDMEELEKWGVDNFRRGIADEKDITEKPPTITSSFITFEYNDEVQMEILPETAEILMEELLVYKKKHGKFDGFWDERLKNE